MRNGHAIIQSIRMRKLLESRFIRLISIVVVAFLATCFAIFSFNLFSPPRPIAELLPTPSATRRPPPTITPVSYPPTPNLVLGDDFKTQENFPKASGVKLGYEYVANSYLLSPPLDPGFVRVLNQSFTNPDYRNLSLNVSALPETSAPVEYGVLFWHGEDDRGRERFLAFTINTKSTFRLLAYEPVENEPDKYQFTEVISPTLATVIHVDDTPNNIRLDIHPRRMLAYINDSLVLDTDTSVINDWRLRRDWDGRVGLIALTMDSPGAQARFTHFDIYADTKRP